MTEDSWPSSDHSSGAVADADYESLAIGYVASGLIGVPTDLPLCFGDSTGRQVKFRALRYGHVRGHTWYSGAVDVVKSVGANSSGSTRYDLAVLKLDRGSNFNVRAAIHAGTAGAGVPTPTQTLGASGVWELPIASIKVINGATTIAASDVTPLAWYLGPPSINCTKDTRPPASLGQRIYESDTNTQWVGNGSTYVSTLHDSGWVAVGASTDGWTSIMKVRLFNGAVYSNGFGFKRTGVPSSAGTDRLMGWVPVGYRPDIPIGWSGYIDGTHQALGIVDPTGAVILQQYTTNIATGIYVTPTQSSWIAVPA